MFKIKQMHVPFWVVEQDCVSFIFKLSVFLRRLRSELFTTLIRIIFGLLDTLLLKMLYIDKMCNRKNHLFFKL